MNTCTHRDIRPCISTQVCLYTQIKTRPFKSFFWWGLIHGGAGYVKLRHAWNSTCDTSRFIWHACICYFGFNKSEARRRRQRGLFQQLKSKPNVCHQELVPAYKYCQTRSNKCCIYRVPGVSVRLRYRELPSVNTERRVPDNTAELHCWLSIIMTWNRLNVFFLCVSSNISEMNMVPVYPQVTKD